CLLVVDEAQNLAVDALEELRMLSNFQLGSSALLQIFLLGQPEFRDLVQSSPSLEQLRQRVIATHHLDAMDADEVEPYIMHRMQRAGWTGRPQLTEDAYEAIFDETGGVPRKINALMNRTLLMGAVEQLDTLDGGLVTAVIADMAGKPFEYEAPLSAHGEVSEPLPVVEEAIEELAEPEVMELEEEAVVVDDDVLELPSASVISLSAPTSAEPVANAADAETMNALHARVERLETRVAEQDADLRRVLALVIDWVEKDNQSLAGEIRNIRAA
ncbi:MAG: AAA family ATPase, partial [Sphingorhabdus sp.]